MKLSGIAVVLFVQHLVSLWDNGDLSIQVLIVVKKKMKYAPAPRHFNLSEMIDQQPLGAMQIWIIGLCAMVALLDGFDLLSIGVAAPAMADTLHIAPSSFGPVFSAALLGLMLGAFGLGPVADRFGRRQLLIGATATFGFFTVLTAAAASLPEIVMLRFLAGVGLGGAMPSFISLAAEYTPRRSRRIMVGLLWTGFPVGGVLAGFLASQITDVFGWQSLFYVGGVLPILLSSVLVKWLPDSVSFMVTRGAPSKDIRWLITRMYPTVEVPQGSYFQIEDEAVAGVPLWHLFTHNRTFGTAVLWTSYFVVFLLLVTNAAWTPILLRTAGMPLANSAIAVAVFSLGSVVGTPLAGWLVNRFGARAVVPAACAGSALALGAVGFSISSFALVVVLQGSAGFFLGVASSGLIALAAAFYPTAIRSTGVGWAMGLGRFGSFVGPLAVGMLAIRGWSISGTFAALGATALFGALFTSMIGFDPSLAAIDDDEVLPAVTGVQL
jgi:AAHS family 4-hydroxybenzoate transporter-like MFS transporter